MWLQVKIKATQLKRFAGLTADSAPTTRSVGADAAMSAITLWQALLPLVMEACIKLNAKTFSLKTFLELLKALGLHVVLTQVERKLLQRALAGHSGSF